jgi:hypothetical protein
MVPAYVFYAQSIAARDRNAARAHLEKALRLDPDGPRATQIESMLALLEGKDLEDRGVSDVEPFRQALRLDPANAEAQAALLRIDDGAAVRQERWRRRFLEGSGALVALSLAILFVGPRRRSRAPR